MSDTFDIAARETSILGQPPLVPPIPQDELPASARETINRLRAGVGLGPLVGPISEFTAIMLKSPELMDAHLVLANFLFRGNLPVRDRELAILRIAWLSKAPYEWGEHVKIGKRLGDITSDEVARVQQGSAAPGWSEHESAILRAVEELVADAKITQATWTTLAKTWTEAQQLEFPILVGQYLGVAYLQNSIGVPLGEGNPGLTAR
jgi:alkylhydroperoxidase family enzyme